MTEKKPSLPARITEWAKSMHAVWALLIAVAGGLAGLGAYVTVNHPTNDQVDQKITSSAPKNCVIFPTDQPPRRRHTVTDAAPGEEAIVTWYDLERVGDCGSPCLGPRIVNGDGRYHKVETSIQFPGRCEGLNFVNGIPPRFPYKITIPDDAEPGCAESVLELNFVRAGRYQESPPIPFTILNPDGSRPEERCS